MDKGLLETIIREQEDSNYRTEVQVSTVGGTLDVTSTKVIVVWTLDMELRSWGLKELTAYLVAAPLHVDFETTADTDEMEPGTLGLDIDTSQLRIEWEPAGYMAPLDISLTLDNANQIDYSSSYVTFGYLKKE